MGSTAALAMAALRTSLDKLLPCKCAWKAMASVARAGGLVVKAAVKSFLLARAAKFRCCLFQASSFLSCRRVRARMAPEASGATLAAAPADLGMMPLNGSDQAAPLVDLGFDSSMAGFGMSPSDWLSGAGAMAAAAGGHAGPFKLVAATELGEAHSWSMALNAAGTTRSACAKPASLLSITSANLHCKHLYPAQAYTLTGPRLQHREGPASTPCS